MFNLNRMWRWYDSKPDYLRFYLMFVILSPVLILMVFKSTLRFGNILLGLIGLWRILYISHFFTKKSWGCLNNGTAN